MPPLSNDLRQQRGERASTLLQRIPAPLSQTPGGKTSHRAGSLEVVHPRFLELWNTFQTDMRQALNPHRARLTNAEVLRCDRPETFFARNEGGVQGRFVNNVCIPVAEALRNIPGFANFHFADLHVAADTREKCRSNDPEDTWSYEPDIMLVELGDSLLSGERVGTGKMVVEMKTPWSRYITQIYKTVGDRIELNTEPNSPIKTIIGQVVTYLYFSDLKCAVLSDYDTVIFIKRVAAYKFAISPPILRTASAPHLSFRETLLAFIIHAHGIGFSKDPAWNADRSLLAMSAFTPPSRDFLLYDDATLVVDMLTQLNIGPGSWTASTFRQTKDEELKPTTFGEVQQTVEDLAFKGPAEHASPAVLQRQLPPPPIHSSTPRMNASQRYMPGPRTLFVFANTSGDAIGILHICSGTKRIQSGEDGKIVLKCCPVVDDVVLEDVHLSVKIWLDNKVNRKLAYQWWKSDVIVHAHSLDIPEVATVRGAGYIRSFKPELCGLALITDERTGLPLDSIWDDLSKEELAYIKERTIAFAAHLKTIFISPFGNGGVSWLDSSRMHMLWDKGARTLTIQNFELIGKGEEWDIPPESIWMRVEIGF